jgi:hypothetical protein
MGTFGIALGLALVIEGLLPMLLPQVWRQTVERVLAMTDPQVRLVGMASAVCGCLLILALN